MLTLAFAITGCDTPAPTEPSEPATTETTPPWTWPEATWKPDDIVVAVFYEGVPQVDMPVVSHTPDGAWQEMQTTDEDGLAVLSPVADGIVSVLVREIPEFWYGGTEDHMVSLFDVQPGDRLVVGNPALPPTPSAGPSPIRITVPEPLEGATRYRADFGCGYATWLADTLSIEHTFEANSCFGGATSYNVLVRAFAEDNSLLALATGTDLEAPYAYEPANWSEPDVVTRIDIQPPDELGRSNHGRIWALRGGVHFSVAGYHLDPGDAALNAVPFRYPSGFADAFLFHHRAQDDDGDRQWFTRTATPPATVDYASSAARLSADWVEGRERPTVAIANPAARSGDSATVVELRWGYSGSLLAPGHLSTWRLVGPPAAEELTAPLLPPALHTAIEQPVDRESHVHTYAMDYAPDYESFRSAYGGRGHIGAPGPPDGDYHWSTAMLYVGR